MKKLRLLAFALALILLLSSCSGLFGKDDTPTDGLGENQVQLSDYKIVVSRYFSSLMEEKIAQFQSVIKAATGVRLLKNTDMDRKDVDNEDFEIVLGRTSRVQSAAALENIGTRPGYVVARIGNKIVINGSSDFMVLQGMEYFLKNLLKGDKLTEGVTEIEKDYLVKKTVNTVYFYGGTATPILSVVCSDKLDHDCKPQYGTDSTYTGNDYLYDKAFVFRNQLIALTGQGDKFTETAGAISGKSVDRIPANILYPYYNRYKENYEELKKKLPDILQNLNDIIPFYTDADDANHTTEILFGETNRDTTAELKENLARTEYGILCSATEIAVFGWTTATVMAAVDFLLETATLCKEYETGAIRLPIQQVIKETYGSFAGDVPQFTAGNFAGSETSGSGTLAKTTASGTLLEYFEKVSSQDYEAYLTTLEKAGYQRVASNEVTNSETNRKNYYRTYTGNGNMVHAYYVATNATEGNVRIVSAKLENINLPNTEEQTYKKVTETTVTQMRLAYSTGTFGMCYIVTLEDGSFIIFDGGGDKQNGQNVNDHIRLYRILSDLYQGIFGHAPTVDQPITIAAWMLTHQHWDHWANFTVFCKTYCQAENSRVKIEQYICNLGSAGSIYNTYNPGTYSINNLLTLADACKSPFKVVEAHTGQNIYVRNVMIEVLYTQEDLFPLPIAYFNNTSMVTRFHMRRSTGQNSDGSLNYLPNEKTVMFLGDLHYQGDLAMQTMYGGTKSTSAFLKSDVLQVAHHGWQGCSQELYDIVDADILLWPASNSAYRNQTNNGNSSVPANGKNYNYKAIDRWIKKNNGSRWVILVADTENYTLDFRYIANPGTTLADLIASGAVSTTIVDKGEDLY